MTPNFEGRVGKLRKAKMPNPKRKRSEVAKTELPCYRAYMGLASVSPTVSALDFVHAKLYGENEYDRPFSQELQPQERESMHLQ